MQASEPGHELNFSEYNYQALLPRQIRLLHVPKASSGCSIVHTNISSAPPYNAVSYTWNSESPEKEVVIGTSRLRVIPNIETALPHLIRHAETEHLWIDAICINQEDEHEKEAQIPLMGEIYKLCRSCLVWLGDITAFSEAALDAIPRMAETIQADGDSWNTWEREGISIRSHKVLETALWKGIIDIFSRPWFKRVWTFQESVLPPKVLLLVGPRKIRFKDMETIAFPLLNHLSALQNSFPNAGVGQNALFVGFLKTYRISLFRKPGHERQKALDTMRLLYFTNPWSASNRIDKVYGVLGLADQSFQRNLNVDYSTSGAELSKQIVDWYGEYGEDLFFLNLATSNSMDRRVGLPRWIPDFTAFGSHWAICVIWHRFRAGMIDRKPFPNHGWKIVDGELHVEGFQVDEVSQVIPHANRGYRSQVQRYQKILDWEDACLDASKVVFPHSQHEVPEAHWETIISAACSGCLKPDLNEYLLLKSYLQSIVAATPLVPEQETRHQDFLEQIRRLFQVATVGRFYTTRDGRIGIGPKGTSPGDRICVFYNGFTPFILRAASSLGGGRRSWRFVGDTYTWGIMDGEVFLDPKRQAEVFVLESTVTAKN